MINGRAAHEPGSSSPSLETRRRRLVPFSRPNTITAAVRSTARRPTRRANENCEWPTRRRAVQRRGRGWQRPTRAHAGVGRRRTGPGRVRPRSRPGDLAGAGPQRARAVASTWPTLARTLRDGFAPASLPTRPAAAAGRRSATRRVGVRPHPYEAGAAAGRRPCRATAGPGPPLQGPCPAGRHCRRTTHRPVVTVRAPLLGERWPTLPLSRGAIQLYVHGR
jgi:hypothetical protein